jgi:hypothetical protein
MSDYQVTLVNNKMNEFFIKFYGPAESALTVVACWTLTRCDSAVRKGSMEDSRRAPGTVPLQESVDRLHEQDLPSEH